MSENKPEPEKKSGNTWWIAGAALVIGYYVGQAEKPAGSGAAYAEAPAPIITPAEDDAAASAAVDEALEAAADAVDAAGEAVEEVADASDFVAPEEDQAEYRIVYAGPPTTTYADASDVEDATAETGADAVTVETGAVATTGPWTRYQSANNATATQPTTGYSTYQPRRTSTYVPPAGTYTAPKCESTGCYGVISTTTGQPRTQYVSGYTRKDGTYVRPYYRSKRN